MSKRDRSKDKNLIGDFTDPELVTLLTGWLESSGARELEIIAADGQALKIVLGAAAGGKAGRTVANPALSGAGRSVKAPAAGVFRNVHPSAEGERSLVRKGQKLQQSAVLGFIEIGPVLLPVVAGEAGNVREIHVRAGDLVGYGTVIATTEPAR